jgi:two-component system chemotaxis response regulator CheB
MEEYAEELVDKLRAAKGARLRKFAASQSLASRTGAVASPLMTPVRMPASNKIIFLGASTGGTEAIKEFLMGIPADCPPILIVQHMPEAFTASFAKRLDTLCLPKVVEAQGGEKLEVRVRSTLHQGIRICRYAERPRGS